MLRDARQFALPYKQTKLMLGQTARYPFLKDKMPNLLLLKRFIRQGGRKTFFFANHGLQLLDHDAQGLHRSKAFQQQLFEVERSA
jgi:hypothetical protein